MNLRVAAGCLVLVGSLCAIPLPAQHRRVVPVVVDPPPSDISPPAGVVVCAGGPNDLRVEVCGPKQNVLEARLGDNVYREVLPGWDSFGAYGSIIAAPHPGAGAFALVDRRRPGAFIAFAWKESGEVWRPRRVISVSPESDPANLTFRAEGPDPVRLEWLSPTTLKIAQHDPSMPGDDKDVVRVIRFDPAGGEWYRTWPRPGPNSTGEIVKPRAGTP